VAAIRWFCRTAPIDGWTGRRQRRHVDKMSFWRRCNDGINQALGAVPVDNIEASPITGLQRTR
jgi:hypothetical protein